MSALDRKYAVHRTTVGKYLKRVGVPTHGVKRTLLSDMDRQTVINAGQSHMSVMRIATLLGASQRPIVSVLDEAGVSRRGKPREATVS